MPILAYWQFRLVSENPDSTNERVPIYCAKIIIVETRTYCFLLSLSIKLPLVPVPRRVKIHSFNLLPFTAEPFLCGSNMTTDTGVIESHNYPNDYPGFSRCAWIVTAGDNKRITFQLRSINFQQCCSCDRIQIR